WKPPAHSPEENMVRQKCSGIRRSYLAGGDDGALGEIWTQLSEALSGAPGKALAACMLFSAFYFSIGRPNPGLALVSFLMMMILANGEKIISGFLDAGVAL
ncbi:hypothetical protein VC594_22750, partial [Citrobacter freundii]|nr:hypothetical protein [Citrobacter freundii]MDV0870121.1 hypothetical protein [Citrobacter freundii]MDV1707545.1 hypothetical protein [Citrobacter freundii]MDV1742262.1 hypothetical protein [Citrobacter freundii]MEB0434862.1 hypothetical protein [Citrobacter freundii]